MVAKTETTTRPEPTKAFLELRSLPDDEFFSPENVEKFRHLSRYEKLKALAGRIHLDLDIDELRGRNRR